MYHGAWKALRSAATVTGYGVPGGALRGRCAWKALRHRRQKQNALTGVLPSRQIFAITWLPRTSSPVTVVSLRTAFQAVYLSLNLFNKFLEIFNIRIAKRLYSSCLERGADAYYKRAGGTPCGKSVRRIFKYDAIAYIRAEAFGGCEITVGSRF